jgi:hypothetical protein
LISTGVCFQENKKKRNALENLNFGEQRRNDRSLMASEPSPSTKQGDRIFSGQQLSMVRKTPF